MDGAEPRKESREPEVTRLSASDTRQRIADRHVPIGDPLPLGAPVYCDSAFATLMRPAP